MTMETLMAISFTVIAAIMVLALIFFIPALLQVRRTEAEAIGLSASGGSISRASACSDQGIVQSIHQQTDRVRWIKPCAM
jgi:hypothetical protein